MMSASVGALLVWLVGADGVDGESAGVARDLTLVRLDLGLAFAIGVLVDAAGADGA